jgi:hypothetical protein
VIATAAMTAVFGAGQGLDALSKPPPDQIVDAAASRAGATPAPPPAKGVLVWLAHFAFGAAMGALFRVLRPNPRRPTAEGVVFGAAVWLVSYQGLLPAARLIPPATRDDRRRQAVNLAAHVVYGLTLGVQATRSRTTS